MFFVTRPEVKKFFRDLSRPDLTRPGVKDIFGQLKRVFSDIKHFFDESIRTVSKFKEIKSLSHLELLFVVCEVRHLSIYCDPTRLYRDLTRPDPRFDPTRVGLWCGYLSKSMKIY